MKDIISIIISTIALTISIITAWLTLLRKGNLKMTQPTPILFAYENGTAKISFFSLFYSTAFRGLVVENIYIIFNQDNKKHLFNKWFYTQNSQAYTSGCYIKPEGIAQNHQIFSSNNEFIFTSGNIKLIINAKLAKRKKTIHLKTINLNIPDNNKENLENKNKGIIFEWEPDKLIYSSRIDNNPKNILNEFLKYKI